MAADGQNDLMIFKFVWIYNWFSVLECPAEYQFLIKTHMYNGCKMALINVKYLL